MNKKLQFKSFLLLCAMILGIGNAWADSKSYTITFNDTGTESDSSTKITSISDIINEGASYVSTITNTSNVYKGRSGRGLKLGTGSAQGSLTLNLATPVTPTKITFKARQYKDGEISITVNGTDFTSLTSNFDEYTINYDGNTEVSAIAISTPSKRAYITEVSVYYEDGGSQPSNLEDSNLALTGAPVALTFDLFNNTTAQVISYTTSSTGAVTVANSEYISAVVGNGTITVTPLKKTIGAVEITVNQAADDDYKAGSATFTVTITDSTPQTGAWVLTDLADLTSDDVFVIVGNNGSNYAMSNGVSASNPPSAVAVTVENDEITSDVTDDIKWNIGTSTDGYTFYPIGDAENWLYCTNTNNGVRVGTGDAKHFTLTTGTDAGYLTTTETTKQRYIGIYSSQDWRCYESINSNITGQSFAFYKYEDNATVKKPSITANNVELEDYSSQTARIAYTIKNPADNGSLSATVTEGDWLTLGQIDATNSVIPFTCSANETTTARTATVTLTYTYNTSETVTKAVTVTQAAYVDPNGPGTEKNPYTVAQARAAIDAGSGVAGVYATGIVSAIPTVWSTDYNNITFNIVDKKGDETFLQAFRCVSTTDADASTVAVGDVVVIYGNLTKYNTTYEFAQDCQLVSLTQPVDPTLTVDNADKTINVDAAGTITNHEEQTIKVKFANFTTAPTTSTVYVEYCDADGKALVTGGYDWITSITCNWVSDGYLTMSCSFAANTGKARTAYVKVYAVNNNVNIYSDLVTVKQAGDPDKISDITEVGRDYTVRGTVVATNSRGFIIGDGTGYVYYYKNDAFTQAVGDMVTISGTTGTYGQIIQFTKSATVAEATESNYDNTPAAEVITAVPDYSEGYHLSTYLEFEGAVSTSNSNYFIALGEEQIQISYPTTAQVTALSALVGKTVHVKGYFSGINSSSKFSVMLESVGEVVTIPESKYTTFASTANIDFNGTGVTVYIAKAENGAAKLAAVRGNIAPANTGVILYAEEAGNYAGTIIGSTDVSITDNDMVGVTTEKVVPWTSGSKYNYILQGGVFKKATGAKLHAGKAYLSTDYQATSRELQIVFEGEDEATGIADVKGQKEEGGFFNLSGQRVTKPTKGLYINNGKKMIVK